MAEGVKFPDILKHENQSYPIVDSNDIKGLYITDDSFSNFEKTDITKERRKVGFVVSSKDGIFQYVGENLTDTSWSNINNWKNIQSSLAENVIKIYNTPSIIEENCGNTESFVACKSTGRVYLYVADASEFEDGDGVIPTKDGGVSRYVDITMFNLSDLFLMRSSNLSDVEDRQTALNNLTDSASAEIGQFLSIDTNGDVKFATIVNPMSIKGRVDTVDDLPTDAKKGDVYLVGLEGSEYFEEYVCVEENPVKWECLGPLVTCDIWTEDENSAFDTSVKVKKQGYVDGVDTVSVLGENSAIMTSKNSTISADSSNITITSSDGISVKKSSFLTFDSSKDIAVEHLDNVSFIASEVCVAGYSSGGGSSTDYSVNAKTKNVVIAASSSDSSSSEDDIRANALDSIFAANTFKEIGGASLCFGTSDTNSSNDVVLGNEMKGKVYYGGNSLIFLGNTVSNTLWMQSSITQKSNMMLASNFEGLSTNTGDGISYSSITNSSILGNCGFSGNYNGIHHTKAEHFGFTGDYNTVENCNMTAGIFYGTPTYNKIMSTRINGGREYFNYTTVQSSEFDGFNSNSYMKYISILSSYVSWGSCNIYDNQSSTNLLFGASDVSSFTLGYNGKNAKYVSVLGSRTSGLCVGGNYNNILSSYGSCVIDGDYNTLIGNSSNGNNMYGSYGINISCSNGASIYGNNVLLATSSGVNVYANNSSVFNFNEGNIYGDYMFAASCSGASSVSSDRYSSMLSCSGTSIQESASFTTAISCGGGYLYGTQNAAIACGGINLYGNSNAILSSGGATIAGGSYNGIISSSGATIIGTQGEEKMEYPSSTTMISCSGNRRGTKSYTLYTNNLDAVEIFEGDVTLAEKYASKSNTYNKTEVNELIAEAKSAGLKIQVVDELPEIGDTRTIYLKLKEEELGGDEVEVEDIYDEYIFVIDDETTPISYHYELIGSTEVDLSNFVQKSTTIAGITLENNISDTDLASALKSDVIEESQNGLASAGDVASYVSTSITTHNTDNSAHNDMRINISTLGTSITTHKNDTTVHVTANEKTEWSSKMDKVSDVTNEGAIATLNSDGTLSESSYTSDDLSVLTTLSSGTSGAFLTTNAEGKLAWETITVTNYTADEINALWAEA